jgi:hypothetical protein
VRLAEKGKSAVFGLHRMNAAPSDGGSL